MKQVVITGVSPGIGYACVKMLLSREFRVYGSVRNQTDADRFRNTPFAKALANFERYSAQEAKTGLAPEVIGKAVWRALIVTRPGMRFAIVPKRFVNWTIPHLIPMRILDKLVAQFFGIERRRQG